MEIARPALANWLFGRPSGAWNEASSCLTHFVTESISPARDRMERDRYNTRAIFSVSGKRKSLVQADLSARETVLWGVCTVK